MPNEEGIAICRWVYPGIRISLLASAFSISKWNKEVTCCSTSIKAVRVNSFRSVSTWSLRERPVWIFLPASPHFRVRRHSICEWMSSIPASIWNFPCSISAKISFNPCAKSFNSPSEISPIWCSIFKWAILPNTSAFANITSNSLSLPIVNSSVKRSMSYPLSQSFIWVSF